MKTISIIAITALALAGCTTTTTDSKGVVTSKSSSLNLTPEQISAVHTLVSGGIQDFKTVRKMEKAP